MTVYGYARVSTAGQRNDGQAAQLKAAGAQKVVRETASAAGLKKRPRLQQLLQQLEPGDVLLVTRLDRLARSTRDLLNILAAIGGRQAQFRSLAETWCDTTSPVGQLLTVLLAGIAEYERSLILTRTTEGRQRAKAQGVRFGRPTKLKAAQLAHVRRNRENQTVGQMAAILGVSRSTISRAKRALAAAPLEPTPLEAAIAAQDGAE